MLVALAVMATVQGGLAWGQSSTRARGDYEKAITGTPAPQQPAPAPRAPAPQPAVPQQEPPSRQPVDPPVIIWQPSGGETPAGPRGGRTAVPAQPADPTAAALGAAEAFYRTYAQLRPRTLPTPAQRQRLRTHLSAALDAAIGAALRAEQDHQRLAGPGAPPLQEGDIFTSLAEGAVAASVRDCQMDADRVICAVQLTGPDGEQWQDRVVMARTANAWRVEDVVFGGRFAMGNVGTLSQLLSVVVRQMNPTPAPPQAAPPPEEQTR